MNRQAAYDIDEHRHRFAVWAAARATQRGFTTIGHLRAALEATDIREALKKPETSSVSAGGFNALHRKWCSSIRATLHQQTSRGATYGRAAKLVAVYLKTIVLMRNDWDTPLGRNMHPPIDRILLKALAASNEIDSPCKEKWRSIVWTKLEQPAYDSLIEQLRSTLSDDAAFWTIERYWQPSEAVDDPETD